MSDGERGDSIPLSARHGRWFVHVLPLTFGDRRRALLRHRRGLHPQDLDDRLVAPGAHHPSDLFELGVMLVLMKKPGNLSAERRGLQQCSNRSGGVKDLPL